METIKEMRERHKREIEDLQNKCAHPKISDWREEWWASAHPTGYQVKVCEVCGKKVDTRKRELEPYKEPR